MQKTQVFARSFPLCTVFEKAHYCISGALQQKNQVCRRYVFSSTRVGTLA
jgi:hypothetical protein